MQARAEDTSNEHLADEVAEARARNQHRRAQRRAMWREHLKTAEVWRAGYERMADAAAARNVAIERDIGLEL